MGMSPGWCVDFALHERFSLSIVHACPPHQTRVPTSRHEVRLFADPGDEHHLMNPREKVVIREKEYFYQPFGRCLDCAG